jgi:hypothetical protein
MTLLIPASWIVGAVHVEAFFYDASDVGIFSQFNWVHEVY